MFYNRDKAREKQRQKKLKDRELQNQNNLQQKMSGGGSKRQEYVKNGKNERRLTSKKRKAAQDIEDDMEMEEEYRLLRKIKKGLISENGEIGIEEDSEKLNDKGKPRSVGMHVKKFKGKDIKPKPKVKKEQRQKKRDKSKTKKNHLKKSSHRSK